MDPSAGRVYVTNFNDNTVSVLDTGSNAVVATLPVGIEPYGLAVNPVTHRLYVANHTSGSVSVIALASP